MSQYAPNFMTPPVGLAKQGIDFLTHVSVTAATKPSLPDDAVNAEVAKPNASVIGSSGSGPGYGVLMFRRPNRAELDQGYSAEDYFISSPTAVESPFERREPTSVGLMTPDSPSAAIRRVPDAAETVLYGDANSLLNRITSGLSGVAKGARTHASALWDGLSDDNKKVLGITAAGAATIYGGRKLSKWMQSSGGRTFMLSRALRRGLSGEDVGLQGLADAYSSEDDPSGMREALMAQAAEQSPGAAATAMLLGAEKASVVLDPRSGEAVTTIPTDFFKAAYTLGKQYQSVSSEPSFAYDFVSGDPVTVVKFLKYTKAPSLYLDSDGNMCYTAVPYAAPILAGGALWDKIKSGVKTLGSKLIDGAKKLMDSPIGSALTSIVPFGGIAKAVTNGLSAAKNWISGGGGDAGSDAATAAHDAPTVDQMAAAADVLPLNLGLPNQEANATDALAVADDALRAQNNARVMLASAGITPIDELASGPSDRTLPTSWQVTPMDGALGSTLSDRIQALKSVVGSSEPANGIVPLVIAGVTLSPFATFLLETAASTAMWYGIDAGVNGIKALLERRKSRAEIPPVDYASGKMAVVQSNVRDWLNQTIASGVNVGPVPGAGAPAGMLSAVGRLVRRGGKFIFKKVSSLKDPGRKAVNWVVNGFKTHPKRWIAGSMGAMFAASTMLNRSADQRAEIVRGVEDTLDDLQRQGVDDVITPMNQFLVQHRAALIDDPETLSTEDVAYWESMLQYCYIVLLGKPSSDLTADQRALIERCQIAGDELKKTDPEAYAMIEQAIGMTSVSATGVDPDDEAEAKAAGDPESSSPLDDVHASTDSMQGIDPDTQKLITKLGLGAALPASVAAAEPVINPSPSKSTGDSAQALESPGDLASVVSGDGDSGGGGKSGERSDTSADVSELADSLTADQEAAVEQAASIMALPSSSDADAVSTERAAMNLLLTAGLSAGAAAALIAIIRRRKEEVSGDDQNTRRDGPWRQIVSGPVSERKVIFSV